MQSNKLPVPRGRDVGLRLPDERLAPPEPRAITLAAGDLLADREAAAILGISVKTLANWRWRGEGPRFRKIGKRMVRYSRADLEAFIEGEGRAV